jgi:eukaryotic-like serine/threonine-protein kinase
MNPIDTKRWHRVSPYLDRVLELPPSDRQAYIAALRGEDPEAAADVELLLAEHRLLSAEGFLDSSIDTMEVPLAGTLLGAYTLVSPIGHGGMGSVWLAARSDGRFEGHAAVKLLNAALIGRAAEGRFRREGTILARLTHPHIARLIDAGVSRTGQPYLVLEHIAGRHIDRFCDEERLGINARIRLFLDVQAAVAHAHASLIVHRDLKPSNVLVTDDGQVKLLDFGIAKLIEGDDADDPATMLTREGESALTPKYAAPEQVTGGRVTTATDVYALGVLLYELLTGQHPTGVTARSPAEFFKAVSETEPMRLSAAISSVADAKVVAARAEQRATTPDRWRRMLRGDLETIVGKALKTDPAQRYGSVAEFAEDLRRFIDNLPISARADALGYRVRKFARRHHQVLAAASIALVVMVGTVVFYTTRLATERDRARLEAAKASRVSQMLIELLQGADPFRTPDAREPTVQNLLDRGVERIAVDLSAQPELQAEMLAVVGQVYERLALMDKALPVLERALSIGRRTFGGDDVRLAQTLNNLGVLRKEIGDLEKAEPLLRESLAMRRRLLGPVDKDIAVTLVELSRVLSDTGSVQEAESLAREALEMRQKVFGDEHRETATSKSDLGQLLLRRGDLDGAEALLRENMETSVRVLGADHANAAVAKSTYASLLTIKGDMKRAEALVRETVAATERVFGVEHVDSAHQRHHLATVLELQGRLPEAQAILEDSLRIAEARLGRDHPRALLYLVNLARVRIALGEAAATEPILRRALAARSRLYAPDDWRIAQTKALLGAALAARGQHADAEALMIAADRRLQPIPGVQLRERTANRARLVALYATTGRPRDADPFR